MPDSCIVSGRIGNYKHSLKIWRYTMLQKSSSPQQMNPFLHWTLTELKYWNQIKKLNNVAKAIIDSILYDILDNDYLDSVQFYESGLVYVCGYTSFKLSINVNCQDCSPILINTKFCIFKALMLVGAIYYLIFCFSCS